MEHTEYVDLGRFETYIRYHFHDKHILLEALSHSSYANEKRKTRKCNERLEFLGDSVLSIVVSDFLFRKYPELPEGELTFTLSEAERPQPPKRSILHLMPTELIIVPAAVLVAVAAVFLPARRKRRTKR